MTRIIKRPQYDTKVNTILKALVEKSRENVALELGYASFKSLDMYMRRKNFVWDNKKKNYIPASTRLEMMEKSMGPVPVKASMVISIFNDGVADPRAAAKHAGFIDHREMADYMKRKDYVWSEEQKNYVVAKDAVNYSFSTKNTAGIHDEGPDHSYTGNGLFMHADIDPVLAQYVPLLETLERNKDRLLKMLIPDATVGIIPKFAVPGVPRTKSIYMSDILCRLLKEFSEEKNVTVREIVEAALIEYLRRYGFESEVDTLLKRSS